jgi:hypothetical protein
MNERLLKDTCEARLRILGHPAPASSPSVETSVRFARRPTPRGWYLAHNVTIVSAYLEHRDLAEEENRVERFFINLVLMRLLYAHALVAAPDLALSWVAPAARWLGDPRRAMTGIFLSVARVLPDEYPLEGELLDYVEQEHTVGRVLDRRAPRTHLPDTSSVGSSSLPGGGCGPVALGRRDNAGCAQAKAAFPHPEGPGPDACR